MGNIKAEVYESIALEMCGDPNPCAHELTAGNSSLWPLHKSNQLNCLIKIVVGFAAHFFFFRLDI